MSDQPKGSTRFARRFVVVIYGCGIAYLGCRLLSYLLGMTPGETVFAVTGLYALRPLLQLLDSAEPAPARHRARSKELARAAALSALGFALSAWRLRGSSSAPSSELALLFGAMTVPLFGFLAIHHWRHSRGASDTTWAAAAALLVPMLMPALFLVVGHGVPPRALAAAALHKGATEYAFIGNFSLLAQQVPQGSHLIASQLSQLTATKSADDEAL
jgi:hypothetical protein